MRRLHQTLADYVVIAISPALIMLLVGSLVYFLLAVFYQGQFQLRLHWVMTCFVFAAVLISRISIEDGFERAVLFGAPLAILMGIAANRFMMIEGTWIDDFAWLVNFALIAIIWWCAHKLTWDCTVIDDAEDSSGEGLLQITGLERPADARNAEVDLQRKLEGTTSRQVPAGYWQRYVEHQRRPHSPGVWVVYFSLAALPIFGFGQWFIPASNTAARRYVFLLLCIYVASGLCLLLTTSFLGLRRYLRQRRIEMPTMMANLWLATGAAIVLALLVAAALLPRPSAEYAISRLPFTFGSPKTSASKMAPIRRDGTEDDQPGPAADQQLPDERQTDQEKPTGEGNQPQGKAESDNASGTASKELKSQGEGDQEKSSSSQGQQSQQDSQAKDGRNQRGDENQADRQDQSGSDRQSRNKLDEIVQRLKKPRQDTAKTDTAADAKPKEPKDADKSKEQTEPKESTGADGSESISTPSTAETAISPLLTIFKWVVYAFFILAVLYVLWRYWRDVLAAIRNFLVELRNWWDALWGNRRDHGVAADETPPIKVRPSPFSSYADPFASGLAARYSTEELVRYSFEAFEAWSREHGCPREPEQTPHELARDVARLNSFITAEARNMAELYACVAYSQGSLPPTSSGQLRQLWQQMQSTSGIRTVTADELQSWT